MATPYMPFELYALEAWEASGGLRIIKSRMAEQGERWLM
jgi:hypothetical protein